MYNRKRSKIVNTFKTLYKYRKILFFLSLFILRETELCKWGGGRQRWGERIPSRLPTVSMEPNVGAQTHETETS